METSKIEVTRESYSSMYTVSVLDDEKNPDMDINDSSAIW